MSKDFVCVKCRLPIQDVEEKGVFKMIMVNCTPEHENLNLYFCEDCRPVILSFLHLDFENV